MKLTPKEARKVIECVATAPLIDAADLAERTAIIRKLQPLARRAELSSPDRKD